MGGKTYPTFECLECFSVCEDFGEPLELPILFALDTDGTIIDPATQQRPTWLRAEPDTPPA